VPRILNLNNARKKEHIGYEEPLREVLRKICRPKKRKTRKVEKIT
jgi:hypothetical protein